MSEALPCILITGASSGIGEACALALRQRGWRVFASARRPEDVARLQAAGLEALPLDLAEPASIESAWTELMQRSGGRLDALFNNAAFAVPGAVEDLSVEALRHQFEACFFGWHDLSRRALKLMRQQGFGRIVQNSSVLGLVAMPYRGAYVACKFALEGYSDTLRLELQGSGLQLSSIECGPIRSRFRPNAHQQFLRWINAGDSVHAAAYDGMVKRFQSGRPEPFTLDAAAVAKHLIHALESPRPKSHYYVTGATWILSGLKRFLPYRAFAFLLRQLAQREGKRYR